MRLIDADELPIDTIGICDAQMNMYGAADVVFAEYITDAPTIDPVKHGRWEFDDFDGDGLDYQCSTCGGYSRQSTKYCPNCGAKMDADSRPTEEEQHDD